MGQNVLLWNEGDGTFTEGARPAGVDVYGWQSGAAVGDVNGDGLPDLLVAGYADLNGPRPEATQGFPQTFIGVRDRLYLNEGDAEGGHASFREVGETAGLEVANFAYGLGVLLSDFDRDGDLDVYLANDTNPNRLYENVPWPGGAAADPAGLGFRFEERAGAAGVADPNAGMGVAGGDYDGDGRADIFVTNAREQVHGVFRSKPPDENDPSYDDVRADLGVDLGGSTGWGVSWADLDLDTDLDLVVVNGDIPVTAISADRQLVQAFGNLTAQGTAGRFEAVGGEIGLDEVGPLLARGSAAADYDNDGDLDVAIGTVGGRLVLLRNEQARRDLARGRARRVPPGRRGHGGAPGRPEAAPRGAGGKQLPLVRGSARALRARRRLRGARAGRALAGRRGDAARPTSPRTGSSRSRRRRDPGHLARPRAGGRRPRPGRLPRLGW